VPTASDAGRSSPGDGAQNVAELTRPQRERSDQQHRNRAEQPRLRGRTANVEVYHVVDRVYA
jgi:hypothetical protein